MKSLDSPFATGALAEALERDGSGDIANKISDGTIDREMIRGIEDSKEMRNFVTTLQRPNSVETRKSVEELQYTMDNATYKDIFPKVNEATSSSPSGLHYGHYITAMENTFLTEVNTIFMRVPFKFGSLLKRWSISIHCILLKANKPYLTKLGMVQLFEADFNSGLKYTL